MGLVIATLGWTRHGGDFITRIFHVFKVSQRSMFYCYLVLPPLAMLMLNNLKKIVVGEPMPVGNYIFILNFQVVLYKNRRTIFCDRDLAK